MENIINAPTIQNFNASISQEKQMVVRQAHEIKIIDEKSLTHANDLLQYAKNIKKSIDEKEKELTKPLNDTKQKIIDAFRPAKNEMDVVINILSKNIINYQMELQKQVEEFKRQESERLKKEHENVSAEGNIVEAISIENKLNEIEEIKTDSKIKSNVSSSNITMLWDFEIISANDLPINYLCPDEKKIKQAIKDGVRDIKGVKIFQKPSLRSRNQF